MMAGKVPTHLRRTFAEQVVPLQVSDDIEIVEDKLKASEIMIQTVPAAYTLMRVVVILNEQLAILSCMHTTEWQPEIMELEPDDPVEDALQFGGNKKIVSKGGLRKSRCAKNRCHDQ